MRNLRPVLAALITVVAVTAPACRSDSLDRASTETSAAPSATSQGTAPSSTTTSTTIAPPDESVCPQPYQPQAYRFVAPSQTQVVSSGPVADLERIEIPQFQGTVDQYPGTPPGPPPGVAAPGEPLGIADLGPLGKYSAYVGTTAPQTVYLVNQDRVMALASPQNYTIAFRFFMTPDGAIYTEVNNNDRSGMSFVRWRLDDPCATPADGPPYLPF